MGASGLEATAQGGGGRQAGRRSAPGQSRSAQGGVRTAGLGPAAGGRILAGSARVGELGGRAMLIYARLRVFFGLHVKERNGPGCWFGLKRFFSIFFAKRFNKFDLNLNSTNSNSNQTTSNKTIQSCMNANKQPHLDLEKQPILFIITKFPVKKIKYCEIFKIMRKLLFYF